MKLKLILSLILLSLLSLKSFSQEKYFTLHWVKHDTVNNTGIDTYRIVDSAKTFFHLKIICYDSSSTALRWAFHKNFSDAEPLRPGEYVLTGNYYVDKFRYVYVQGVGGKAVYDIVIKGDKK